MLNIVCNYWYIKERIWPPPKGSGTSRFTWTLEIKVFKSKLHKKKLPVISRSVTRAINAQGIGTSIPHSIFFAVWPGLTVAREGGGAHKNRPGAALAFGWEAQQHLGLDLQPKCRGAMGSAPPFNFFAKLCLGQMHRLPHPKRPLGIDCIWFRLILITVKAT